MALTEEQREIALLPCPFCGSLNIGKDHIETFSLDSSYDVFGCLDCGVGFEDGDASDWNTRTEAPIAPPASEPTHWRRATKHGWEYRDTAPTAQTKSNGWMPCFSAQSSAPPASEQKPAEWDQDAAIEALIDFAPRSSLQAEMIEQVAFDPTSGPVYALTTQGRALLDQLKVAFFAAAPHPDYKAQRDALLKALDDIVWNRKLGDRRSPSALLQDVERMALADIASVKGGA